MWIRGKDQQPTNMAAKGKWDTFISRMISKSISFSDFQETVANRATQYPIHAIAAYNYAGNTFSWNSPIL
jgi:hypothetical protein